MWYYKNKPIKSIDQLPNHESLSGFVYRITNTVTGQCYIGKKALHARRKTRITQKEKKATPTRKIFKTVIKESDWKTYYGSSEVLKKDLTKLGAGKFRRDILELCCTKKYLSYAEVAWQIKEDVLKTNSYNGNILGRWYGKDMENNCFK